jgi:hypothetical protein
VVEELTSNLRGQKVHLTQYTAVRASTYSALTESCKARGHLAIGVRRGQSVELNVGPEFTIEKGDSLITIGKEPLSGIFGQS